MIPSSLIESTAHVLMTKAGIDIPEDYLTGIKAMAAEEEGDLSSFVLRAMLENYQAATEDRRPMCADTGVPRYYVKSGNVALGDGAGHSQYSASAQSGASAVAHRP
jgi:L(+)-tartrate dehydratase alpha subunit